MERARRKSIWNFGVVTFMKEAMKTGNEMKDNI